MSKQPEHKLAYLLAARKNILRIFEAHDLEQLNEIPPGFNNNLVWNAGHVVATMELLLYALSGQKTPSGRDFIDRYRKGTRPEAPASQEECDLIAKQLIAGVEQLSKDLEVEDFSNFKEYTTSFGATLKNVGEAMDFNNMHEAMHLGTMISLRNQLK
ncbi:DinB family protein [Neolewinella aurantiaca]|uniref:DinB family protein n=1 Tax=Neolewinella aurantiaca TaxID=2602767 RepID=A0A5C7FSJ5_9BACT|nr:DinB family protein [Neolewinella aurantiaca]TXF89178.1 DinB family protein [Neolewinella aurantiaca]